MAAKADGSLRACVDYRRLNALTKRNRAPLWRQDDLFDMLHGAKYFSSLDLTQGYHQIRIAQSDVERTAFAAPGGLYQFKMLPFGLCNAPSAFQSTMNLVLRELIGKCVVCYIDDILVFSRTEAEHLQHLRLVMDALRRHELFLKRKKCSFMQHEVKFLGHVFSDVGIKVYPTKVAVVQDWPAPLNVSYIRRFLGLSNYFRRFIKGYANLVRPMNDLLKKDAPFCWSAACESAFVAVKDAVQSAPVLVLPDTNDGVPPFHVWSDASGTCIGAVLMQNGCVIAYEARSLTPAERNYTVGEQELLAVVHALTVWRCYLEGHEVQVMTDHQPNIYLPTKAILSRR